MSGDASKSRVIWGTRAASIASRSAASVRSNPREFLRAPNRPGPVRMAGLAMGVIDSMASSGQPATRSGETSSLTI